ncbi:MAG: phenylalanine 4-monooxygenase [Bacteriovoracaceae bacterium]|nr:phenylalanine 4-monooxygenase [Bacteriovoracaceae bacterium]
MAQAYESKTPDERGYVNWDSEENKTWKQLVERQSQLLPGTACSQFMEGLDYLGFTDEVPQLPELNKKLDACNGWGVEPVPAIIQPQEFFTLLANKRFPAATFIRRPEHMDYLQEPDIFHEVFGHTPLLANKAYGDFMEAFGKIALEAQPKDRRRLFRLFWFTIEFGLTQTPEGLRAYGGGILSSPGETAYCLTEKSIKQPFDVLNALRTPYRIDIMQPLYFILNSFEDLFTILDQDILAKLEEAKELGDFEPKFPPKKKTTKTTEEVDGAMPC